MGRLAILNIEHWLIVPLRDDCGKFAILLLPRAFALKRERAIQERARKQERGGGEDRRESGSMGTTDCGNSSWARHLAAHDVSSFD